MLELHLCIFLKAVKPSNIAGALVKIVFRVLKYIRGLHVGIIATFSVIPYFPKGPKDLIIMYLGYG